MICSTLNPSFPLYLDMYVIYSYGTGVYCLPGRSGAPVEPEGDPGHHHNQAGGDVHLQLCCKTTSRGVASWTMATKEAKGLVFFKKPKKHLIFE